MNLGLPPCATTGVGSLPLVDAQAALACSFAHDLPFLPELPSLSPGEYLVPAALAGLEAGAPDLSMVRRFVEAAGAPRLLKLQMAGPATLVRFAKGLEVERIEPWLQRRAVESIRLARSAGHRVLFVLDEPVLEVARLPALLATLRAEGASTGVHCCGDADCSGLLELDLDLVSLDVERSLDALLADRGDWQRFVDRGGALSLGIVPTTPGLHPGVRFACERAVATLKAATRDLEPVLARCLVSPACGLALHKPDDAARIMADVRLAQATLRARR